MLANGHLDGLPGADWYGDTRTLQGPERANLASFQRHVPEDCLVPLHPLSRTVCLLFLFPLHWHIPARSSALARRKARYSREDAAPPDTIEGLATVAQGFGID